MYCNDACNGSYNKYSNCFCTANTYIRLYNSAGTPQKQNAIELTLEEATQKALTRSTTLKNNNMDLNISEQKLEDEENNIANGHTFQQLLQYIKQNADYSGNLMNRLTNLDGAFAQKFQERFPNFNTDEILMATMIHHKWKLSHMATIFQTTLEAIRKRKTRLLNRISDKIEQDIDPEEYLIQL